MGYPSEFYHQPHYPSYGFQQTSQPSQYYPQHQPQADDGYYRPSAPTAPSAPNSEASSSNNQIQCLVICVALAALTGVAGYFGLVNGLNMLDVAQTGVQVFKGGFVTYMGATFATVAVGNVLYGGFKVLFDSKGYGPEERKWHIGISVLAPIAAIPFAIKHGLELGILESFLKKHG